MSGGVGGVRTRLDWRSIGRLLTAHHPGCGLFREDVFRVGRLQFCTGCFTTYPIALFVFASLVLFHPVGWFGALALGVVVGSVQFLSVAGLARTRPQKIAVKAALGVGLAGTVYGVLAAPFPLALRLATLVVFGVVCGLAMVPRARRMVRTCETCFFKADWERCPGMALLRVETSGLGGKGAKASRGDPHASPQGL